tara:strand:+ start:2976 stop:3443 length:468 start_codon:yes stop_codon:yes gene_type:complete
MDKDREIKSYIDYIKESEQKVVYPTNFTGKVQGAIASIHSQVMAIALELANEKQARNPQRYKDADNKVGGIEEVDITRAMNLIFHSEWKKLLKTHNVQEWTRKSLERSVKLDERSSKKNQRAMRSKSTGKDHYKVDLGTQGYSRDSGSDGGGSNQ